MEHLTNQNKHSTDQIKYSTNQKSHTINQKTPPFNGPTTNKYARMNTHHALESWRFQEFGFARVRLDEGTASLISCINETTSVHTTPNYGAFDPERKTFVAASGNPETGEMQVVLFDVATGKTLLDTPLTGLKAKLGVSNVAPFVQVWGVSQLASARRIRE